MLYNKQQIQEIIPYGDKFLWVDEIEKMSDMEIVGYKNTSKDDWFYEAHFTDFPIMPGVLIIEGLAQTASLLLRQKIQDHKSKHVLAYQVRSAFFYAPVLPGARVKLKAKLVGFHANKIGNFVAEAYVGEELKCEARFSVAVMDKDDMAKKFLGQKGEEKEFKELPVLKIGKKTAKYPIIQGGMGVRVSLHSLAGHVAKEGGVGIISISGMTETSEVEQEIEKARTIAGEDGVIGVNIMGVAFKFVELLEAALKKGVDLVIQGAGFRPESYELCKKYNTPFFAMASSLKVAQKAESLGADAVVIEGMDAGGHLGFKEHEMRKTMDIIKDVIGNVKIPVIAAGGVFNGKDIVEMLRAGASGVQMATRFVATNECDVADEFKQAYVAAKEDDVALISSPVGLPGRALKNAFVQKILDGTARKADPRECQNCMGAICNKKYCILKALESSRTGDMDNGLVFAGTNVFRIDKIVSVRELIQELVVEANNILKDKPLIKYV